MSKKPVSKALQGAEAVVFALFVIASGLGSMSLLNLVDLTDQAQAVVGYVLGAYALLVFGYLAFKAVENK
jgi:hypothetical protein